MANLPGQTAQVELLDDISFINTSIPGALVVTKTDEALTIVKANEGYFSLIGYTRAELAAKYGNEGRATLHPDDLELTQKTLRGQMKNSKDQSFSLKARLVNKYKGYRWVHFSGRMHEDTMHCMLIDVSEQQAMVERLDKEQAFNELIASLSGDAFFDCDLKAGIMRHSNNIASRLQLGEILYNFPADLLVSGVIAPESFRFFDEAFARGAPETGASELHFCLPDGTHVWYMCYYQMFYDSKGEPERAVGKLVEVTEQRNKIEQLSAAATMDALTGLLNKQATEQMIIDALMRHSKTGQTAALLIIDVDNFKAVNDHLGHLYGDLVLSQLAQGMRGLFRSSDVIGRIGGDEFFVFLERYGDLEVLKSKADEVCRLFQQTFQENNETVCISASIGIACSPLHGTSFHSLYQNADTALYISKQKGKNTHTLYSGETHTSYQSTRTEIESAAYAPKSFHTDSVEYVFRLLYDAKDLAQSMIGTLQLLAEHVHCSRAYIMEFGEDKSTLTNTFEWCAPGIRSVKEKLQNIPITQIASIVDKVEKTGIYVMQSLDDLCNEQERAFIAGQDIKAMLHFAIMEQGELCGYIGFDECTRARIPLERELEDLSTVCHVMGTFLSRQRALEAAQTKNQQMRSVLDALPWSVYVIDRSSHRILYENSRARARVNGSNEGCVCHMAYLEQEKPCEGCPLEKLSARGTAFSGQFTPCVGLACEVSADIIAWEDGADASLLTCAQ